MARRRFAGGVPALRQGQRRVSEWGASFDQTAVIALGPNTVQLVQSFPLATLFSAGLIPSTIVRTRGELWVHSDQSAANEMPFGALSMQVTSEPARVAGAASLLAPIIDEAADQFFVYQFFAGGNSGPSTGALFGQPWSQFTFDSKAMRKIDDGQAIVIMMENASAAHQCEFVLKFRILFKKH